jgi:CHAD domain-containing protein
MKTPLMATPLPRAIRRLASGYLKDAAPACERLLDPADVEVLHDFRVALRRLRSLVRAYQPWLQGHPGRKLRRRLRKLVRRTGPARDAEVQLAWLQAREDLVQAIERPGFQWMIRYLESRREAEYQALRARLPKAFESLCRRFLERLGRVRGDDAATLGAAAAQGLRDSATAFHAHLEQVRAVADEGEVHAARIAGKRLRYLLEPLADELPDGKALVKELRVLQDLMGEIHDHQVLSSELLKAAEQAGAARLRARVELSLRGAMVDAGLQSAQADDETAGLLRIARLLHHERQARFAQLHERLEAGDVARFLDHLHGACERLREAAASPKP